MAKSLNDLTRKGEEPYGFPHHANPIGLARNPQGREFNCTTCEYYSAGNCEHPDPRLKGTPVGESECCNRYESPGMKVLVE